MGQYWVVMNLDKREVYSICGSKLGEALISGSYTELPFLLSKPTSIRPISKVYLEQDIIAEALRDENDKKDRVREQTTCAPGLLERLPAELLVMIFDNITDYEDVASFSMTNKTLWLLGYRCIQMRYAEECGPWAGDRLICFGDYASVKDLPEGVFTEDELKAFRATLGEDRHSDGNGDDESGSESEDEPLHFFNLFDTWETANIRNERSPGWGRYPWKRFTNKHDSFFLTGSLLYPLSHTNVVYDETREWLLCNLTKRQYVHAEAIAKLTGTENAKGPFIGKQLTLGEVVVAHICWSSENNTSLAIRDKNIYRGRWAGDRFEITTVDKVKNVQEWKDVSDEVGKEMEAIWKAEFGKDWRSDA